jgi:ubiquinone/menaquinone biosynthesis C-methylase UbiE
MGDLKEIPFDRESGDVKNRVASYWTKRAEGFAETRHDEAHSYKADLWLAEMTAGLPKADDGGLRILDVGCGTGFFEMLLAPLGHRITGIDITPDMIERGRELLARHNISGAELMVMDAERPDFPDGHFDAVISRNLTWNLPHPGDAYREWHRVLKPGGVLLNYDAEYAKGFHKYDQAENCAHSSIDDELIEECHDIYHMLSVSSLDRPEWDIGVLREIGFAEVTADCDAGDRLYGIKDRFYMPDRMFCIRAVK